MRRAQPRTPHRRPFAQHTAATRPPAASVPGRAVALAVLLVAALPATSAAQVVRGAVTEAGSGRGVEGAIVRLVAADSQQVAMLLTGADGSFEMVAPRGGTHVLEVEHVLYDPVRTPPFVVPQSGATARLVRLNRRTTHDP